MLDRAVCNAEWRLKFQEGAVRHLIRASSDHCPLLISTGSSNLVGAHNRSFRFQAVWVAHEQFETLVKSKWCPDYHLL